MRRRIVRLFTFLTGTVMVFSFFQFSPAGDLAENEFVIRREKANPPFLNATDNWVDSVFNSLSPAEKIAQLMMVQAYSGKGPEYTKTLIQLIKKYKVGGLIFFQGTPYRQAKMVNQCQAASKVPLLIAQDAEWGLGMRLDSTISYPRQMMLGAIRNEELIYKMGADIAHQLRDVGVQVNFAPVLDVNNNPANPVINSRSFGENRTNVAQKGLLYMRGLQDNQVLAVGKHFPGHGDTNVDSHLALPKVTYNRQRLDSIELFPFKELIYCGLGGIMTAHLNVPALDPAPGLPATLSPLIVDSLLKKEMHFRGLIFTDAMNMGGVTSLYKPVEANVKALKAGNDILLMPDEISKTISAVLREIKRGNIRQEDIDNRCKKVLTVKFWAGLSQNNQVKLDSLDRRLNLPRYDVLKRKLIAASLTVLKNNDDLIPFRRLDTLKIASVAIGETKDNAFQHTLNLYKEMKSITIRKDAPESEFMKLISELKDYNLVVVSMHNTDMRASDGFGITPQSIRFVDSISVVKPVVFDIFANPYALTHFSGLKQLRALVLSYEDNPDVQDISAQLLFGAIGANGVLPVTINDDLKAGNGITVKAVSRLRYGIPEEEGLDAGRLEKIDSIALDAISQKATPGCEILVARNGMVIYQKAFGYFTYRKYHKVKMGDIYDLASLTKISATIPAVMHLYEQNKLDVDDKISAYLPYLDTTNKKDIVIRDILLHQAGLQAWIPFYISTLEPVYPNQDFSSNRYSHTYPIRIGNHYYVNKHLKYKENYYSSQYSDTFSIQVADHLFINRFITDTIFQAIASSEVSDNHEYKYSDLGFYLLYQAIEKITGKPYNEYVDSLFYRRLGAGTTGYLPIERFDLKRIAPTEDDLVFRKQIVHGYVHDPGAAMLGGVSGHAGLFSDANDLAKLMQLYLNKGEYGGIRYFDASTIDMFTSCVDCSEGNRRGLGFDKPEPDTTKPGPTFHGISLDSYGHTGFTGTMTWIDPSEQLVYIFLSNRVYPDAINNKLVGMNVRTKIQQAIYKAIKQEK